MRLISHSGISEHWEAPSSVNLGILNSVFLAIIIYSTLTTNPLETMWSIALLWLILTLFWWQTFPPILVYALTLPWLEIHFNVFEANFYNLDLNYLFSSGRGKITFWIASTGFLAVIIGLQLGLKPMMPYFQAKKSYLYTEAQKLNQNRIVLALILFRVLEVAVAKIIPWGSSLRQLVTYFSGIGVTLSLCLAIHFFITKQRPIVFFTLFTLDLITSFYSYFGSWKGPIIILLLGASTKIIKIKAKQIIIFSPIFIGIGFFVFVWQAIKPEYRAFLSQGERTQSIAVSQEEALIKFTELSRDALNMTDAKRQEVYAGTFRRIGYLEYFSDAVAKVPDHIPHERGKLLLENLSFAFVPRVLNPSKGVKNDRLKVEKYTDNYFGENSFSSFSLGHYCEAYIDWGWGGSLLQLFALGLLGAFLTRQTFKRFTKLNPVLLYSLLFCILMPWGTMQQDFITMIGRVTWNSFCQFIVFSGIYRWIDRFLTTQPEKFVIKKHVQLGGVQNSSNQGFRG